MISITTQESSSYVVRIRNIRESNTQKRTRRVSRVSTLDGDSVVTDSGYTDTDRELRIRAKITAAQKALLDYMFETFALWNIVVKNEYFSCAPRSCNTENGQLSLLLLIES